jgi:hypothetical protein
MATLTTEQQATARQWIAEGMKISDFQRRLEADFAFKLTYMEARFLIDDLKVIPKDPEPPAPPAAPAVPAALVPAAGAIEPDAVVPPEGNPGGGDVQVTVDASDGQGAAWLIDTQGRPGLVADEKGYRPSQPDLMAFQVSLERELAKLGY